MYLSKMSENHLPCFFCSLSFCIQVLSTVLSVVYLSKMSESHLLCWKISYAFRSKGLVTLHLYLLLMHSLLGNGYPCFELSAVNADKPPLTISQIKERVKQFEKAGESYLILLCLWMFLDFLLHLQ